MIAFAHKQGLAGLCLDSLGSLPEDCRPPKEQLLNLIGITTQLEHLYNLHLREIRSLADFYNKHGIKPVLMKGYGLSLNYPRRIIVLQETLTCFSPMENGAMN